MPKAPTILLFDSGLGGLTVFQEVRSARPDANFIYVADDAGFPYGNFDEDRLIERVIDIAGRAISDSSPDLVVVACNTASTLALGELRAHFRVPFVGTVPAIKPAAEISKSRVIGVLGTEATVRQPYVDDLAARFAAKEALAKSLGAPVGLRWRDAWVCKEDGGRPFLEMTGTVAARAAELGVKHLHVSLSHDAGIASADTRSEAAIAKSRLARVILMMVDPLNDVDGW